MKVSCNFCKRKFEVPIKSEDYKSWVGGEELIEEVANYLEPWEREILISNTCSKCWKSMWPFDVEDE